MPTETITGITFPSLPPTAALETSEIQPVLKEIAECCVKHLRQGGYLSEAEAKPLLTEYNQGLGYRIGPPDFLAFAAECQAEKHSLTVDGEVQRMQKLLRASLQDRVHYWTFGPIPGRAGSLYDQCPSLRAACSALGCPAVMAGEDSVMHVASINPVAALVAAAWIGHELSQIEDSDMPFVFPFLIDLTAWNVLLQRHFAG